MSKYKLERNLVDNSPQYITFHGNVVLNLADSSFINNFFAQDLVNCLNQTLLCKDALIKRVEEFQNRQRKVIESASYVDDSQTGRGC